MAEAYFKLGIERRQRIENTLQQWRDRVGFKFTLSKKIERWFNWHIGDLVLGTFYTSCLTFLVGALLSLSMVCIGSIFFILLSAMTLFALMASG